MLKQHDCQYWLQRTVYPCSKQHGCGSCLLLDVCVYVLMQFLESYKSVTMESMATAFDVGPAFLDQEISDFIVAGRLGAKIDKVSGIIETKR